MEATSSNKWKWHTLIGYAGMIILIWLIFHKQKMIDLLATNNKALSGENIMIKNANGTLTTQVATFQGTESQLKDQLIDKDLELKKLTKNFSTVSTIVKFQASAKMDPVKVEFTEPITFDTVTKKAIPNFERSGNYEKDFLCFDYKFNNKGFELDNAEANISITSVTGFKRKWFLGRQYAVTEVTPGEKNVTIVNLSAAQTVVPVKWYIKVLYGAVGYGIGEIKNGL